MTDSSEQKQREWWQQCSDAQFLQSCAEMTTNQLQELTADMSSLTARLAAQVEKGSPDAEWLSRAKYALRMVASRRSLVKAELTSRNEVARTKNSDKKRRWMTAARKALDSGDVAGAVRVLVDFLDPDVEKEV